MYLSSVYIVLKCLPRHLSTVPAQVGGSDDFIEFNARYPDVREYCYSGFNFDHWPVATCPWTGNSTSNKNTLGQPIVLTVGT